MRKKSQILGIHIARPGYPTIPGPIHPCIKQSLNAAAVRHITGQVMHAAGIPPAQRDAYTESTARLWDLMETAAPPSDAAAAAWAYKLGAQPEGVEINTLNLARAIASVKRKSARLLE
jgi:hypothetical protein